MKTNRIEYMDAGRALFMLLGIPYHVGLAYKFGASWMPGTPQPSTIATLIAGFIHTFRMPAFFIIAGFFSAVMLRRQSPWTWASSRIVRLGVPFVVAAILFNPIQMYVSVAAASSFIPSELIPAWKNMLTSIGTHWVRHLWFLSALMLMSLALALAWGRVFKGEVLSNRFYKEYRLSPYFWTAAVGGMVVWSCAVSGYRHVLGIDLTLLGGILDVHHALKYMPYFILGVLILLDDDLRSRFTTFRWPVLFVSVSAATVYTAAWAYGDGTSAKIAEKLAEPIAGIFMAQLLISFLAKFADRPNPVVKRLVNISFTVYLVHMPLVVVLAWRAQSVRLDETFEFFALSVIVTILSIVIGLLVQRSQVLTFLLNGTRPRAIQRDPTARSQA